MQMQQAYSNKQVRARPLSTPPLCLHLVLCAAHALMFFFVLFNKCNFCRPFSPPSNRIDADADSNAINAGPIHDSPERPCQLKTSAESRHKIRLLVRREACELSCPNSWSQKVVLPIFIVG